MNSRVLRIIACAVVVCASARLSRAQSYESTGIRAQGMSGAFVAIADDASATWWNPAGLATGAFFNGIVEQRRALGSSEEGELGVAFAVPSLGVSYYRLKVGEKPPGGSTEALPARREDQGTTGIRLPAHVLSQFGATVGQSLGDHLVLGATLKVLRADQTRGDLDLGAMVNMGTVRLAVVMKNVRAADLTADGAPLAVGRQVRVGAAYVPQSSGSVLTAAAVDADLTTGVTAAGDARRLAGGVELRLLPRLAARAGVGVHTVGAVRGSISGGVSVALPKRLYVDGQLTQGADKAATGWGCALRMSF